MDGTTALPAFTPNEEQSSFLEGFNDALATGSGLQRMRLLGGPGCGKAQPLTAKIATPEGWVRMGDIRPGDTIVASDGGSQVVTEIHPRGRMPVYRVTFSSGTSAVCTEDHLWLAHKASWKSGPEYRVVSLRDMLVGGAMSRRGKANWRVPLLSAPVNRPTKSYVIPPYTMGALIGDGGLTHGAVGLSLPFEKNDILHRIESELDPALGLQVKTAFNIGYTCRQVRITSANPTGNKDSNPYLNAIRDAGLDLKSGQRFIPDAYMYGDAAQRLDLLRGLMDTDGSSVGNRIVFHSTSYRLIWDVATLVRSLGGTAAIRFVKRKDKTDTPEYFVRIRMSVNPFHLKYKACHWMPARKAEHRASNIITAIDYVGMEYCQCISVSADDRLYVTDDYVVTHNSYTTVEAARAASDEGFVVFLLAPTHQAVGVLAKAARAAALPVRPYEPDPKVGLRAGQVLTATTHSFAKWTQKARSVSANYGVENPVAKDSWIGRAMKRSWDDPPAGIVVLTDEISMYQWQMSSAIDAMLARLVEDFDLVLHVAIGDPDQLIPVRSASYDLVRGENMGSPSRYVVDDGFATTTLQTNMRAKDPALRAAVETFKAERRVLPPPPGQSVYRWDYESDMAWMQWIAKVKAEGPENCVVLAYRRATVAAANDKLSQVFNGAPSHTLQAGLLMRVQETFAPAGQTLYHSSQLVTVEDVVAVDDADDIIRAILPPTRGHENVHEPETQEELFGLVTRSVLASGAVPMALVNGTLHPAIVATEHTTDTPSQIRWNELLGAIGNAAFRANNGRERVRRGMTSLFYHVSDAARLKLEAPFAMTSHRAQGSTYPHVLVIADGAHGTRLVDSQHDATRNSSSYVMLSRASKSLTIMWPQPVKPMSSRGWF